MKVLVDSNILIEYWENGDVDKSDELTKGFLENDVFICGAVRAELLHGAISERHFKSMTAMLDAFDQIDPEKADWQSLGKNLYEFRTHGITVPFTDALIATLAIRHGFAVWTLDGHFDLMKNVLDGLKLL